MLAAYRGAVSRKRGGTPAPAPTPAPGPGPAPAPAPTGTRYVSLTGNNANSGLTEGTAWRTLAYAASQLAAGQICHVKAGTYSSDPIVPANSGISGAPIIFQGYTNVPGDAPLLHTGSYPYTILSSVPTMDNNNRTSGVALNFTGKQYIQLRNFQIRRWQIGIYGDNGHNCLFDNCLVLDTGNLNVEYDGAGIKIGTASTFNTVSRTAVGNACSEAIAVPGNNNTIVDTLSYCNDNSTGVYSATDYYLIVAGAGNTITRHKSHRIGALGHGGHGCGAKSNTAKSNIFTDCEVVNMDGESFYVKHRGCEFNTFNSCYAHDGGGMPFALSEGAQKNTFNTCVGRNMYRGVLFYDTSEDGGAYAGGNLNTFNTLLLENISTGAIQFYNMQYATNSNGNVWNSLQVVGAGQLFNVAAPSTNSVFDNTTLTNIPTYATYSGGMTSGNLGVSFTGTDTLTSCGFTLP